MSLDQNWLFGKLGEPASLERGEVKGKPHGWYARWKCGCAAFTHDDEPEFKTQWHESMHCDRHGFLIQPDEPPKRKRGALDS